MYDPHIGVKCLLLRLQISLNDYLRLVLKLVPDMGRRYDVRTNRLRSVGQTET